MHHWGYCSGLRPAEAKTLRGAHLHDRGASPGHNAPVSADVADMPVFAAVLGRNLRRLRASAGSTQAVVAERAGVSRAHYAALEAGLSSSGGPANPRLGTLVELARALRVSLKDVLADLEPD